MKTIILVTSHGLRPEQTRNFWSSLVTSGYTGTVALLSNDLKIQEPDQWPFTILHLPWRETEYFRSSSRLFLYQEALSMLENYDRSNRKVILTGIRDVIFQKNPEHMPHDYLNVYYEDKSSVIGPCPYNSKWIRYAYGEEVLRSLYDYTVLCAEIVVGTGEGMNQFLADMTEHAATHENKSELEDQGMLNYLYHTQKLTYVKAMNNEASPVYTVGRVNPITVDKHLIFNRSGGIPHIIHQYDRHVVTL